jgi:hypothetical protein
MSKKIMHVDNYVNLSPMEKAQFDDWLGQRDANKDMEHVVEMMVSGVSEDEVKQKLEKLEEKTRSNEPVDVRIEAFTDKGYVTAGWYTNGDKHECYVKEEPFRK